MPVGSVQQGPRRTNFNAVAALRTIQPAAVRPDNCVRAAIAGFDRLLAHPLVTDARAALAKDESLRVVSDHLRKIYFGMIVLLIRESFFQVSPVKSLFLQLALAATIAHRAIERVVREQKLEQRSLRFLNLFALRGNN